MDDTARDLVIFFLAGMLLVLSKSEDNDISIVIFCEFITYNLITQFFIAIGALDFAGHYFYLYTATRELLFVCIACLLHIKYLRIFCYLYSFSIIFNIISCIDYYFGVYLVYDVYKPVMIFVAINQLILMTLVTKFGSGIALVIDKCRNYFDDFLVNIDNGYINSDFKVCKWIRK